MRQLIPLAILALAACHPAHAGTVIATPSTFAATVKAAGANGDTVLLASTMTLPRVFGLKPVSPVRIITNAGVKVTVAGGWADIANLTFVGGTWGSFRCDRCASITFDGVSVVGPAPSQQAALSFIGGSGIAVTNSTFDGLWKGLSLNQIAGGAITANTFTRTISDGVNVANSQRVDVIGNTFVDFQDPGPGDHPDPIQVFTTLGKSPTTDITIGGNIIRTRTAQGIFVQNPGKTGLARIAIENNAIVAGMGRGLSLDPTATNSRVIGNSVATWPGAPYASQIYVSPGVTRCGNTQAAYGRTAAVIDKPC